MVLFKTLTAAKILGGSVAAGSADKNVAARWLGKPEMRFKQIFEE